MLIVADENIPLLDEFFGDIGEIRRCPGRSMSAHDVEGADLLLVRSVTRVDARLLGDNRPRFVGSATIGTDHVDMGWLADRGIPFASAPGCNARAVAEYVATVLAMHACEIGRDLSGVRLGVIGCGHVGRAVVSAGQAFGMDVLVCDPLVADSDLPAGVTALSLDGLMASADIVTLHVPLTSSGQHPTRHLLRGPGLSGGIWRLLLNTSRGAVVDNDHLLEVLRAEPERRVVLDVWEHEPAVPGDLLSRVWLGTPHIAGYSCEGKWRGTGALYQAACAALGMAPLHTLDDVLRARGDKIRELEWPGSLAKLLSGICPVPADTQRLRAMVAAEGMVPATRFDALRRDYPERREFSHFQVRGAAGAGLERGLKTETPQDAAALLAKLGFSLTD